MHSTLLIMKAEVAQALIKTGEIKRTKEEVPYLLILKDQA
jgi:hypothetical protein